MAEETKKRKYTPEEKRIMQNQKRAARNLSLKRKMKTSIKKYETAVAENKPAEEVEVLFKSATKTVDKMVTKGILHKNCASRKKSRLSKATA